MLTKAVHVNVILVLAFAGQLLAGTVYFTGGGGNQSWANTLNWSPGLPGTGDTANLNASVTLVPGESRTIAAANVFTGANSSGTVNINTNASLQMNGLFNAGYGAGSNATINVEGYLRTGNIYVGYNGVATLNLSSTGSLNVAGIRIGQGNTTTLNSIINVNGGSISSNNVIYVGMQNPGIFNMNSGTVVTTSSLAISWEANNYGQVNLDGGTITAYDLLFNLNGGSGGHMNITSGKLFLTNGGNGDLTSTINGFVASGLLTGYGVNDLNHIHTSYDSATKITTVWATPEPATMLLLSLGALALQKRRA